MDKNRAPLVRGIILSFTPSFYPSVLRQGGWRSFLYLALLCLVVYGFMGYRMASVQFDEYEETASEFYEKVLPDFNFADGNADYPPDKPHIHEEKEGDKVFAVVVDTSGKSTRLDEKYTAGMLITKTEMVTRDIKGAERREAIPKTDGRVAAKDFFAQQLDRQRPRAVFSRTLNEYVAQLVGKVILVALVGGVLLFADKKRTDAYPFAYYFNVGCYAATPFVLSAFARGWHGDSFLTYASYGMSLMLFLALAVTGLARCRQEDARELAQVHANAGQSQ